MKHLKENNETYLSHLKFAWTVGFYTLICSCLFIIHGLFPFVPIPSKLNLNAAATKMRKWDAYTKLRSRPKKVIKR